MGAGQVIGGSRVLVTGAGGFIGGHLCRRLHELGAEVHGTFRASRQSGDDRTRWWPVDLADFDGVRRLLTAIRPDVIYHLASHVVGARALEVVLPTFRSNLASTVNLLIGATELGCRRVIMSGSMEEPDEMGSSVVPASPYAAAKWAGSGYARMFHGLYGTPVIHARLFMVYGPAQRDLKKLIPYVILSFLGGEAPRLMSGRREVDWIYVDDVVEGLMAMMTAPQVEGQSVDLGSGVLITVREIVERIAEIMGCEIPPSFGSMPDRPMEQVRLAGVEDTYARLGWQPMTSLETGLRETIDWYRRHRPRLGQK